MILKMNVNLNFKDKQGAAGRQSGVSQTRVIDIARGNLGLNGVRVRSPA
jgi:hypothetical protein